MEKISSRVLSGFLLLISAVLSINSYAAGTSVYINYVPPASNTQQTSFIRISNLSSSAASVAIIGITDKGVFSENLSVTFSLKAKESKQFLISDFEKGNTAKGLTGAIGTGNGIWRLFVYSASNLDVMGFVRTPDGFLNQIHDISPGQSGGTIHTIGMFNPAANANQQSRLQLINNYGGTNTFTISAIDDAGNTAAGGSVKVSLSALQSLTLTSTDLEQGNKVLGLSGAWGTGTGKWRLIVTSDYQSIVMGFMELPGGYLSNLSTVVSKKITSGDFPTTCSSLNGASIYSQDTPSIFLGFFGTSTASLSINNPMGDYGSNIATNGIRNKLTSRYGSTTGTYSSNSSSAFYPPIIVKGGVTLGYLTTSVLFSDGAFPLTAIDAACSGSSAFTATAPASAFAVYE